MHCNIPSSTNHALVAVKLVNLQLPFLNLVNGGAFLVLGSVTLIGVVCRCRCDNRGLGAERTKLREYMLIHALAVAAETAVRQVLRRQIATNLARLRGLERALVSQSI